MKFWHILFRLRRAAALAALLPVLSATPPHAAAQSAAAPTAEFAPCGVVDAIEYPIDISDTLRQGYDDFALFRPRFGGLHVGIDIAFNRWGEPVYAAARGRVTYSDVNGWDTEKGVVIIEHTMPDGSLVYTLYGHMEVTDRIAFPPVGDCVGLGDIVGVIGWPSRGLPHLHYEIRSFLPDDGGPGYVTGNPLLEGWFHPLDFTETWRVRLGSGAYLGSVTFNEIPTLPPALVDSGTVAIASGSTLVGFSSTGQPLWRINAPGVITGLAALPGDRIAAHTREGQAFILQNGRFLAVWDVVGPEVQFIALGETLIFATEGGGAAAFATDGTPLWAVPGESSGDTPGRVVYFDAQGETIALAVRTGDSTRLRIIERGSVVSDTTTTGHTAFAFAQTTPLLAVNEPRAAYGGGGWLRASGNTLVRITPQGEQTLATLSPGAGRTARLASDQTGNSYLYLGDSERALVSFTADGHERWRVAYPAGRSDIAPLMAVGRGCLLYTLDATGWLNVFDAATGTLANRVRLYPGGVQNGSPRARLLKADSADRVLVGGGFLTTMILYGELLGGQAGMNCLSG
jgi:murein DD-endopeptidase MepM/ murein hydrolase activator NlpD